MRAVAAAAGGERSSLAQEQLSTAKRDSWKQEGLHRSQLTRRDLSQCGTPARLERESFVL